MLPLSVAVAAALGAAAPAFEPARWAPATGDPGWVDVRAFGARGDGVADDTAAFRAAAATGKSLFVPRPPVAYVLTGFVALRASIRGDGSLPLIRMRGADGDPDQGFARNMLVVDGYTGPGLTVSGLHLDGGWDGRSTRGEWSHGVRVTSSRNVTIRGNIIERTYGDCVFVGHYAGPGSFAPANVVVEGNLLSRPRRCCVAVVSGANVAIRGNRLVKTSHYVAAIDLEPDPLGYQRVDGVVIADNDFDVAPIAFGGGAVSLHDPEGNRSAAPSGNVTVSGNHGRWTPAAAYLRLEGSSGLVGVVPARPWANVTTKDNRRGR
jgi:hypothetical protein